MSLQHVTGSAVIAVLAYICADSVLGVGPSGGPYEITQSTIDGGGVMRSLGGSYELSGTIGQPDAGVLVGDGYQLTGGFWFETPRGDCNADGLVNLLDHADFVPCLDGPGAGWTDPNCRCFDFDGDSDIDLRDFAGFVALFAG